MSHGLKLVVSPIEASGYIDHDRQRVVADAEGWNDPIGAVNALNDAFNDRFFEAVYVTQSGETIPYC